MGPQSRVAQYGSNLDAKNLGYSQTGRNQARPLREQHPTPAQVRLGDPENYRQFPGDSAQRLRGHPLLGSHESIVATKPGCY